MTTTSPPGLEWGSGDESGRPSTTATHTGARRAGSADTVATGGTPSRSRRPLPRVLRGRDDDARWIRPALLLLLAATAVLYIWGLSESGYANSFYSAAVQAGTKSWKAFFYGSSDAGNLITVDKPPVSLWVMALSARIFGVNSWSILLPQALEGVAAVGMLYLTVRRALSAKAGLLAGAVLALTPVATLMFRFNNPDALLVLLMIGGAYAVTRALEAGRTRWLVLAGTLIGFAFLTKMLQALLVVPAFAITYLVAAPTGFLRRVGQLLLSGLAMVLSAGWYIAIVSLVPAADRPYIGGSQHNSILELTLGYNGFGRLTGNETGSVGGGGGTGGTGMWGATGITRLFSSEMGGQIAWLIPAALLLGAAGLWVTRRAVRTDATRAGLLIWGGWMVVTGLVFSFMHGIFHAYYNVALAPGVAGVVGIGAALMWEHRARLLARLALSVTTAVTAAWSYVLLDRTPDFVPALRYVVLVVGLVAAAGLALPILTRRFAAAFAVAAVLAGLGGPAAYAIDTASTGHTGSIVTAGPAAAGGMGGFGGGRQGGPGGARTGRTFGGQTGGPGGQAPQGFGGGTPPTMTGGAAPGGTGRTGGQMGGGAGGLLQGSTASTAMVNLLKTNASSYTWVAAAVGSNSASGYQLATGDPVMALGGFNGSDPAPTLAQFQAYVAAGKVHYFIGGSSFGGMRSSGGSSDASSIATWVAAHFTAKTVGGTTVYDLTQPTSSTTG